MAFVLDDRIKETTTTTGTGTINLDGAATRYQTFVAGVGNANTCYYCIEGQSGSEWEVGKGTVTDAAPDTLSRDTVYSSSNADALVSFSAGTKDVFCVVPAKGMGFIADENSLLTPTNAITLDQATGNEIAMDLSYTVNKATSGNDTGLLISATDTASPGTSYILDCQIGGSSVLTMDAVNQNLIVDDRLTLTASDGTTASYLENTAANNNGIFVFGQVDFLKVTHDTRFIRIAPKTGVISMPTGGSGGSNEMVGFRSGFSDSDVNDVGISRLSAGELLVCTGNDATAAGLTARTLDLNAGAAGDIPLQIELAASPTGNALEINTNGGSGGDLLVVDSSGNLGIGGDPTDTGAQTAIGVQGTGSIHIFANGNATNDVAFIGRQSNSHVFALFDDHSDSTTRLAVYPNEPITFSTNRLTSELEILTLSTDGDLLIGTGTSPSANAGKIAVFGDAAASPTMGTNTAGIFAKDDAGTVRMYAIDEDGTERRITTSGSGAFASNAQSEIDPSSAITLDEATGDEYALNIPYTINKATSGDVRGLILAATETAVPANHYFIDATVAADPKFRVDNAGNVTMDGTLYGGDGASEGLTIQSTSNATTGTIIVGTAAALSVQESIDGTGAITDWAFKPGGTKVFGWIDASTGSSGPFVARDSGNNQKVGIGSVGITINKTGSIFFTSDGALNDEDAFIDSSTTGTVLRFGLNHNVGDDTVMTIADTGNLVKIDAIAATDVCLNIEQAATHTGNSFEINSNGGTGGDLFVVDEAGRLGIGVDPIYDIDTEKPTGCSYRIKCTGNGSTQFIMDSNRTSTDAQLWGIVGYWNGKEVATILGLAGDDTVNKDDGYLSFRTGESNSMSERMRIEQDGQITFYETAHYDAETQNDGDVSSIDWTAGNVQELDLNTATGAVTLTFTSPGGPGNLLLRVTQGGTARDITWPAAVKWDDGDGEPTWTGDTSKTRIVGFYYDGTNYWASATATYT